MKMIILVGCPGSGKSTLATMEFPHMIRVNQDSLGSKEECLKLCNNSLANGEDVIIDRCNHTERQRAEWIKIGRVYGATIHCVYLEISTELGAKRISTRENHPTIFLNKPLDYYRKIVVKFKNETTVPSLSEHFDSVLHIRVK